MKVYIGNRKDYTSFALLQKAYNLQYGKKIEIDAIKRTERGKLFFTDQKMPCFNISHYGEYIICVFDDQEIGIDIQKIRAIPEKVINRFLKTNSSEAIEQILEWTKFESFGKMNGVGIPYSSGYDSGIFLITSELTGYIITVCTNNENDKAMELVYI